MTSAVFTSISKCWGRNWPLLCKCLHRSTIIQVLKKKKKVHWGGFGQRVPKVISIFCPPEMSLSESFTNQSVQFYDAVPTKLLETSEDNTEMINSWVANKTNNKIQHLVDSVSPGTQLMLLNAVSFKGQWRIFEDVCVWACETGEDSKCLCLCPSGQWEIKFDFKHRKDFFSKLNGDLVPVPVLYHQEYLLAMTMDANLKALVISSRHLKTP